MTAQQGNFSKQKCEKGVNVAKHQARHQRETERPCTVVGLVDAMKVENLENGMEIKYRERTQLKSHNIFFN